MGMKVFGPRRRHKHTAKAHISLPQICPSKKISMVYTTERNNFHDPLCEGQEIRNPLYFNYYHLPCFLKRQVNPTAMSRDAKRQS